MLLYMNSSLVDSLPKSSVGSAQSRSHIGPELGGSLNRSICEGTQEQIRRKGMT